MASLTELVTCMWNPCALISILFKDPGSHYPGMKQAEQREAILCFSRHPEVGVLLMDVAGAVGLDLSFVTHVFLMEPLADKSMEEQVMAHYTYSVYAGVKSLYVYRILSTFY